MPLQQDGHCTFGLFGPFVQGTRRVNVKRGVVGVFEVFGRGLLRLFFFHHFGGRFGTIGLLLCFNSLVHSTTGGGHGTNDHDNSYGQAHRGDRAHLVRTNVAGGGLTRGTGHTGGPARCSRGGQV